MNKTILNKITDTIKKYNLLPTGGNVIVALSGGFDSICLLHALRALKYNVRAVHINHGLRPQALGDQIYVGEICEKWGIELSIHAADVTEFASQRKISLETAGREIRYTIFAQEYEAYNAPVATAHNANDSAESFIMHLLRGSGLAGLSGIRPRVNINGAEIIRPLIQVARSEIEEYCRAHDLRPREDDTNNNCDFYRNDIRHKVMPALNERGALSAIARASDIISEDDDFLRYVAKELVAQNINFSEGSAVFDAKWFNSLHLACKRRVLFELLPHFPHKPVSLLHIDSVIECCAKNYGGKLIELPGGITAKLQNGKMIIKNE